MGFRVQDLGFRVWGSGFGVQGSGLGSYRSLIGADVDPLSNIGVISGCGGPDGSVHDSVEVIVVV